jgi:maleylpyruvate isomerase
VNDLDRDLAGARRAHAQVLATLHDLSDDEARQPSRLPGWTVGHVVTHIARNAEGHLRMLRGAIEGEVAAMYPGGRAQRSADIEAGAPRPAAELIADVSHTTAELEAVWAAMTPEAWDGHGEMVAGPLAAIDMPFIRWREVTVHHADLGLDYSWSEWDAEYVKLDLGRMSMLWASRKPMGMTELPAEALAAEPRLRLAWLLGRAEIEGLAPAGIMG